MLQFNELRIDSDKHLIVDVEVITDTTLDPEQIISINHLYVGFGTNIVSECYDYISAATVLKSTEYPTDSGTFYIRRVKLDLDLTSNDVQILKDGAEKTLIYIRVTTAVPNSIILNSETCIDTTIAEGYAYDRCLLVNKVLDFISHFDNLCANTDAYANYIVQVDGLELAIQTGNFIVANNYWNKFFINQPSNSGLTSNCGC